MFCNKCGHEVDANQKFCNNCGNRLVFNTQNTNSTKVYNNSNYTQSNRNTKSIKIIGIVAVIVILIISIIIFNTKEDNDNIGIVITPNETEAVTQGTGNTDTGNKRGKYKTAIITDNVYSGISVKSIDEAKELIVKDSTDQKKSDYPKEIIDIENSIIQKYSITAVNLKEMDVDFAKELENVIDNIYRNYPKAKGYLTNLSLTNMGISNGGAIAYFMPIFKFGLSNTSTTRPWIIKTQVHLNSTYFLNPERLDTSTEVSSKAGHFPKNATKYSPLAHEFGHYLSFIALLNHYSSNSLVLLEDSQEQKFYEIYKDFADGTFSKQMLEEAHQNYVKDNGEIGFDDWRGIISQYALSKDESGEYIYDETIAEGFHDVYLNGDNASKPSKYIVEVLKKYLER